MAFIRCFILFLNIILMFSESRSSKRSEVSKNNVYTEENDIFNNSFYEERMKS